MRDLHRFDPSPTGGVWTQLTAGGAPSARYGHGMAAIGSTIYVFGGCDSSSGEIQLSPGPLPLPCL